MADSAAWVLVVLIGLAPDVMVWPGATYLLLGRDSASYTTKAKCEAAREMARDRWKEIEKQRDLDAKTTGKSAVPLPEIRRSVCVFVPAAQEPK